MGLDFETGTSQQRYGRIQLRAVVMSGRGWLWEGRWRGSGGLRGGGEPTKQCLLEKLTV